MSQRATRSTNEETRYVCRKCPGMTFSLSDSQVHRQMHEEQNRRNIVDPPPQSTRSRENRNDDASRNNDNNRNLFSRVEEDRARVQKAIKRPSASGLRNMPGGSKQAKVVSTKKYDRGVVHTKANGA